MALTPAQHDVVVRAEKTFVQTLLPTVTLAYGHFATHQPIALPGLVAGAVSAAAAACSVLWNGASVFLTTRKERKLVALAEAIDAAVAARVVSTVAPAQEAPAAALVDANGQAGGLTLSADAAATLNGGTV